MARDPETGGTGQVPRPNAEAAEAFLRRLADTELRWVLAQPDPPPGPSRGRPPLAPAARAVNRVRAAAGALISAGVIDDAAAMSVLAGLLSALTERSKLPLVHPYRSWPRDS